MERKEPSYSVGGNVNWCSQLFDREDPLDKGMTTPSSTVAWRIPWTEEPGGLQSMGSQRVELNLATEHKHEESTYFV